MSIVDTFDHLFVITGGPESGKSTLTDALAARGLARSVEARRGVIQDQVAVGGKALPWSDPRAFAELMLSWEMRSYRLALETSGPVIFDRGIPDVAGYLRLLGIPVPDHVDRAARTFRYSRQVFRTVGAEFQFAGRTLSSGGDAGQGGRAG